MEGEIKMTITEMSRLKDWLKSKGLTAEEILECIDYIAFPSDNKQKEMPNSPPANN